jgi:hypothetical protein
MLVEIRETELGNGPWLVDAPRHVACRAVRQGRIGHCLPRAGWQVEYVVLCGMVLLA